MANPPIGISGAEVKKADASAEQNNALWYTFHGIGRAYLIRRGSLAAGDADNASVHGYNTIEQAYTNPNGINPLSQVTISQWDSQASLPVGGGTIGVVETVNITAPVKKGGKPKISTQQNPTTAAAKHDVPGVAAIGTFFTDLQNPALWIRIGKIAFGSVLLIIGIAKLTGASEKAGSIAGKAVKIAPFL